MKTAIEKLRELREKDSSILAICKDYNGETHCFMEEIPFQENRFKAWWSRKLKCKKIDEEIMFDNINWMDCIVTYKDLEDFEVESITISKADYDRLLACEKKLENILNIISK